MSAYNSEMAHLDGVIGAEREARVREIRAKRKQAVAAITSGESALRSDTKVVSVMTGIALPSQSGTPNEHHALVDARWGKLALDALGVPFARFDPERDYELPSGGGPGMSFPA